MSRSDDYLSEYIKYMTLKNYSLQTVKSYTISISKFFKFSRERAKKKLTVGMYAREYLLHRHYEGKSWITVNIDYSALVLLFKHVLHQPWDYNMLPRPKTPKKVPVILSYTEVTKLINSIKNIKHQTIVITLYVTGLRISELIDLKIEDIDFERKMVRVYQGKGSRDRIIHVPDKLLGILRRYIEVYIPVIYLYNGFKKRKKYSASSVRKIINRAALRAGLIKKVSPHTFRHCYATHHLEFGTNLVYINRQLGHSTLTMTAKYLHLCQYKRSQIIHPINHLKIHLCQPIL